MPLSCPHCNHILRDNAHYCDKCGQSTSSSGARGGEEELIPTTYPQLHVGDLVDKRYKITGVLGRGGMGTVYRARRALGGDVALKALLPEYARIPSMVLRFRREARAAGKINHKNVVRIYEDNMDRESGVLPYFVMELLEGKTLRTILTEASKREPGRLELWRAVSLMEGVCRGVSAAHQFLDPRDGLAKPVVHRDLKPENVIVLPPDDEEEGAQESVKVVDFGIAKVHESDLTDGGLISTDLSARMGSLPYMSPEQCNGEEADIRSDVYSLGIMLYEMLTGRRPFHSKTDVGYINKHIHEEPPTLHDLDLEDADVPREIFAVALHALEKDPARRPAHARALLEELRRARTAARARMASEAAAAEKRQQQLDAEAAAATEAAAEQKRQEEKERKRRKKRIADMQARLEAEFDSARKQFEDEAVGAALALQHGLAMGAADEALAAQHQKKSAAAAAVLKRQEAGLAKATAAASSLPKKEQKTAAVTALKKILSEDAPGEAQTLQRQLTSDAAAAAAALRKRLEGESNSFAANLKRRLGLQATAAAAGLQKEFGDEGADAAFEDRLEQRAAAAVTGLQSQLKKETEATVASLKERLEQAAATEAEALRKHIESAAAAAASALQRKFDQEEAAAAEEKRRTAKRVADEKAAAEQREREKEAAAKKDAERRKLMRRLAAWVSALITFVIAGTSVLGLGYWAFQGWYTTTPSNENTNLTTTTTTTTTPTPRATATVEPKPGPLLGHQGKVNSVAISPDGRLLASGGNDKTVRLWNIKGGAELFPNTMKHANAVTSVAFSPDGKLLATSGMDGAVFLWDTETGARVRELKKGSAPLPGVDVSADRVFSVAFSPDGATLAGGSTEGRAYLWRGGGPSLWKVGTPVEDVIKDVRNFRVMKVLFSPPDGETLVAAKRPDTVEDKDVGVILWWHDTKQERRMTLSGKFNFPVTSLLFSPDGNTLYFGINDKVILWNMSGDSCICWWVSSSREDVISLALSRDGNLIVSGREDGTVELWDIRRDIPQQETCYVPDDRIPRQTPKTLKTSISSDQKKVRTLAFTRDGRYVAGGLESGEIRFWSMDDFR